MRLEEYVQNLPNGGTYGQCLGPLPPLLHGQRTPRRPLNTIEQLYLLWYQAKENSA